MPGKHVMCKTSILDTWPWASFQCRLYFLVRWKVVLRRKYTVHSENPSHYHNYNTGYLVNEVPSNTPLSIQCNNMPAFTLNGWSLSSDGTDTHNLLDTSPTKYRVNGNTLEIRNITRTDEGLYRCIYDQNQQTKELCVYIYGTLNTYTLHRPHVLFLNLLGWDT